MVEPVSLVFDYQPDGTVSVLTDSRDYPMFRYEISSSHLLKLYDGMGKIKEYRFHISGEEMEFYDMKDTSVVIEKYQKEK